MQWLLIIDTAHSEARVWLVCDGEVVSQRNWPGDRTLGTKLLTIINELLDQAGLTAQELQRVAVHQGPGHYGALRTGIVTATMLAQGIGCELVAVQGDDEAGLLTAASRNQPVTTIVAIYN